MIDFIEHIDQKLFLAINGFHNPTLDIIMYYISLKYTWIPLYIMLLFPLWKTYGNQIYVPLISIVLLVILSDQTSVHLFKNTFERYRPCHNTMLKDLVHLVNNHCGGKYGFVSSHASNTFALATFLILQFRKFKKWVPVALLLWAIVVSYSRIYLGVHYPLDVLGGGFLGILLALLLNVYNVFMLKKIKSITV